MRAKSIKENVSNVLKPKSGTEIQTARKEHLDDLLERLSSAIGLIRYASQDFQLNKDDEDYMGFINMGLDIVDDPELRKSIIDFVYIYDSTKYGDVLTRLLHDIGLQTDGMVDEDEIVITEIE